jgi:hypothetical protein
MNWRPFNIGGHGAADFLYSPLPLNALSRESY